MPLRRIAPPVVSPITLAEAKAHCRVDTSDEDTLIQSLVDAAVSHLDGYTGILGRCMVQQTWEMILDAFPADEINIPLGNLISVDNVQYANPDTGIMTLWSASNYEVDAVSVEGRIVPIESWPSVKDTTNAVKVTFKAGFGSAASDVPVALRHAVKLIVGHWYENRETSVVGVPVAELPLAVNALVAPWRRQVL